MSTAQAFLAYARRGLLVLPLRPGGKEPHPLLPPPEAGRPGGVYLATVDPATVERWARLRPPPNIGVRVGVNWPEGSGLHLAVLDIDVKAAPELVARVTELLSDPVLARDTWLARTPSGGAHVWLLSRIPIRTVRLADEEGRPVGELLGDGSYVVVPPSEVNGRRYEWLSPLGQDGLPKSHPLVVEDALEHALKLLAEYGIAAQPKGPSANGEPLYKRIPAGEAVPEGARHATALSLAGRLIHEGHPPAEVFERLKEVRDAHFEAGSHPVTDEELARVVAYCAEREAAKGTTAGAPLEALERRVAAAAADLNHARIIAQRLGERLRWVAEWGWLTYSGGRWARDAEDAQAAVWTAEALRDYYLERARAATTPEEQAEALNQAARVLSRAKVVSALSYAKAYLRADAGEFDSHPYLLNTPNGVLDLETRMLRPHDPALRLTRMTTAPYDPKAECPTFTRFLHTIFEGNERLIGYVQRLLGYTLLGDNRERLFIVFWGLGANGKTTLVEAVAHALGDYAQETPPESFLALDASELRPRNDLARLRGARLVTAAEAGAKARLDVAVVKRVTGGDRIAARYLFREFFEYRPQFTPVLRTNVKPSLPGDDQAAWDRIRLVPFTARIPPERQDRLLLEKLKAEAAGILRWLVEGCQQYLEGGLAEPPEALEATEAYRAEQMDALSLWLEARCVEDPRAVTPVGTLYEDYRFWCEEAGEGALPSWAFGRRLGERGYELVRLHGGVRARRGLRLKGDGDGSGDGVTPGDGKPPLIASATAPGPLIGSYRHPPSPGVTHRHPLRSARAATEAPSPEAAPAEPTPEAPRKAFEEAGAGDLLGDEDADPEPPGRCQGCGAPGDYRIVDTGESWCWGCRPWPTRPPRRPPPRPPHPTRGPPP